MNSSVCIITVTYDNRKGFVESSIENALKCENVKRIIVVDNDSNFNKSDVLNNSKFGLVEVVENEQNLGSSGGFKKGIEAYLVNPQEDFILFLDDDNALRDNTVEELLISYKKIGMSFKNIGLLCAREEMKKYWLIGSGKLSSNILKNNFSFARFSVFDLLTKLRYRFLSKKNNMLSYKAEPIEVDSGYWSGLFITKDTLCNADLPNELFFVYKDDHEFIHNLRKKGLQLFFTPSAQLIEMDKSWATASSKTIFSFPEMTGPAFRAYYSIRNTVYFEEHVLNDSSFFRYINKIFYNYILFLSLYFIDRNRYKLLKKAVEDGINGKMGKNKDFN